MTLEEEASFTTSGRRGARLGLEVDGASLEEEALGLAADPERPLSSVAAAALAEMTLTGPAGAPLILFG